MLLEFTKSVVVWNKARAFNKKDLHDKCSSGVVRHPRDLQVSVATRFCRVLIFVSSQYLSVIDLFHVMIH